MSCCYYCTRTVKQYQDRYKYSSTLFSVIPAVVGCGNATSVIKTGEDITLSCADGGEGRIYSGLIPFKKDEVDIEVLPKTKTDILMSIANPSDAFRLRDIPCDGVGLVFLSCYF